MTHKLTLAGLVLVVALMFVSAAYAQSTVSGSLTGGGAATSSSGSSLSGSVGTSSNSLSGTVVSTSTSSGGGGGGGSSGGGGGGGGGGGPIDICPNISGTQSTLPAGYLLQSGNCILAPSSGGGTSNPGVPSTGGVGGGTGNPGVPNTGEGGMLAQTLLLLAASAGAAALGLRSLRRA